MFLGVSLERDEIIRDREKLIGSSLAGGYEISNGSSKGML